MYVTGDTESTDFPVTAGAFQTTDHGAGGVANFGAAFVAKLNLGKPATTTTTLIGGATRSSSARRSRLPRRFQAAVPQPCQPGAWFSAWIRRRVLQSL